MVSFEDAMVMWVREHHDETRDLEFVRIEHETEYTNDNGTSWPAETKVIMRVRWTGKTGQKHHREKIFYAPEDMEEFLRQIFAVPQHAFSSLAQK